MLVLTRKPGEGIILILSDGRQINIDLVRIGADRDRGGGSGARIGITAPPDVVILRDELIFPAVNRRDFSAAAKVG